MDTSSSAKKETNLMAIPGSSAVIVDLVESPDGSLHLNITAPAFYDAKELYDVGRLIAVPYANRILARPLRMPLRALPASTLSDGRVEYHFAERAE